MFAHIVFWRLHDHAPNGRSREENAAEMKRRFEALVGVVPGLIRCDLGIDFGRGPDASDVALYSEFGSRAELEAYQAHPAHQAIVGFLKDVRTERRVVDYEI